jgi:hypothetical protein
VGIRVSRLLSRKALKSGGVESSALSEGGGAVSLAAGRDSNSRNTKFISLLERRARRLRSVMPCALVSS